MGLTGLMTARFSESVMGRHCLKYCAAVVNLSIVLLALLLSFQAQALKLEAGLVSMPATYAPVGWTRVTFQQSYDTIPVVFSLTTNSNSQPTLVRIQNVDASGFDIAQFESEGEDGGADAMTVAYMAIEEGVHVLPGGAQLEVGTVTTALCQGLSASCSKGWESITWLASYTGTPGIILSVQTNNSNPAQVPGTPLIPTMSAAIDRANATGTDITIERAETYGTNLAETIGYMAIENGKTGELFSDGAPGVMYETRVTPKNVNHTCDVFNHLNTYTSPPFAIAAQNDRSGNNGGWLRQCLMSTTQAGYRIEEDRARDGERNHTTEIAAAVVFEEPFYFDSAQSTCSGTHIESWDSGLYTAQEGSESWNTNWLEAGDDGSPSTGSIRIDTGDLLFTGATDGSGNKTIERQFDLTDFDESYFTYSFEKVGTLDADDDVYVEVSGDGGSNWTRLYTIEGSNANTSGLISHDISAYIATNTRVKFIFVDNAGSGCCFEGTKGIRITKVDISSAADDCSNVIDHFDIDHDGQGITCDVEPVTIRAVDTGDIRVFDYDKTVTIDTSTGTGDWALVTGDGVFTAGAANSGNATYTYDTNDAGVATFGLSHVDTGTISINVVDTSVITEASSVATAANDPDLVFASAGFRLVDASDNPIPTSMVSGSTTPAGAGLDGIYLQAVTTDTNTQTCEGYFQNATSVTVDLGSRCVDPNSCLTGKYVTITNNAVTTTIPNPQNLIAAKDKIPVSLLFGADSKAAIDLHYPDVGRIALDAELDISTTSTMTGGGETISKPADLEIINIVSGATSNPGISVPTGSEFIPAGTTFTVQVRVENADGDLTPNFGNEAAAENVEFVRTHVAPTGGTFVNGTLTEIGTMTATNGLLSFSGSNGLSYSEVGAMNLRAKIADGQYIGQGDVTATTSSTIGRFYPSYFTVGTKTNGTWNSTCTVNTDFIYAGDSQTYSVNPSFTLQARNLGGDITANYQQTWRLFDGSDVTRVGKTASDSGLDITLTQPDGVVSTDNNNGTFLYRLSGGDTLSADHTNEPPFEPTSPAVTLTFSAIEDSDGVSVSAGNLSTANLTPTASEARFGRINVSSAIGPDDRDLPIPIVPEYFSGGEFITNTDDSCTTYNSNNLVQVPASTTGEQGSGTFNNGAVVTEMELTATNSFIEIPFTYSLLGDSYLRFDWDNDGSNDDDPGGKAVFGVFEGRKPVIFLQEVIGR